MSKRKSFGQMLKDAAIKFAEDVAEQHMSGEPNAAAVCMCGHKRSEHCGCGSCCLAPKDMVDAGSGSYTTCGCRSFAESIS